MRVIFFLLIFLSSFAIRSQTLADLYHKERFGIGIAVAYLNIESYEHGYSEIFRPVAILEYKLQKPNKGQVFLNYKNVIFSEALSDVIIYGDISKGTSGEANLVSGMLGRFSLGKNMISNIEKGKALSAGIVLGDHFLMTSDWLNEIADGYHITPGLFVNYDKMIITSLKFRSYLELAKSITNLQNWIWENSDYKYPYITTLAVELSHIEGIFLTTEFLTIFNINEDVESWYYNDTPRPIRVTIGAGYRFNF